MTVLLADKFSMFFSSFATVSKIEVGFVKVSLLVSITKNIHTINVISCTNERIIHRLIFFQRKIRYGCYDEIMDVISSVNERSVEPEDHKQNNNYQRRVRHCNWPRFLTYFEDNPKLSVTANLKCCFNEGQLFYETLETIPPNTDLIVAQFEDETICNSLALVGAISALILGKSTVPDVSP